MDSGISRGVAATVLVLLIVFASVAVAYGGGSHQTAPHRAARLATVRPVTPTPTPQHPNIVFVLTDDLSMDLLRYMPQVQAMQSRGVTFDNYFVTDSLCCPSRSSIFTGDLPHDTGVFTNTGPDGGFGAFYTHHDQRHSFNVYLQRAGYRTAMMGKYLNGYLTHTVPVRPTYVPPGWNEWDVAGGGGYSEFHYRLNENGAIHRFGGKPKDYLVDVMARKGASFVRSSAASGKPFFLELATFAPHKPYVPARRYVGAYTGLRAPHPPSYDVLPTNPPSWLSGHHPLNWRQKHRINHEYDLRVEDVQAVDDMIKRIRATLRATGQLNNTYIVFSSDNGLHMGEYRLTPGKLTAFDTDIRVPLVIDGPGVPAGVVTHAMSENIDLAPTFEQIAGTHAQCDGHTLMPVLSGSTPTGWRNAVLVEHHRPNPSQPGFNPDAQRRPSGDPPNYEAIRTPSFTYVAYRNGEHEFYDLRNDPFELHNVYDSLPQAQKDQLQQELVRMQHCHGHKACWAAGHVQTL